ncbi:MAG: DUF3466 family protein [Phycisphaeraceae bacterium]|nr:DUF3466 family protein [Phycisphaeraceae bacterium]
MRLFALSRVACAATFAGVVLSVSALPVLGAYLPIYGGPTYTPGEGGYGHINMEVNPGSSVGNGVAGGGAQRIDALGNVVGNCPIRWDASGLPADELEVLGATTNGVTTYYNGYEGRVIAINELGTSVGIATKYNALGQSLGLRAVRWNAGSKAATELDNLGIDSNDSATGIAYAINDAGVIVGCVDIFNLHGLSGQQAVRWDSVSTVATKLDGLGSSAAGYSFSSAYALNAAGVTVGSASKYDMQGNWLGERPVRWAALGTTVTELGVLGTRSDGVAFGKANAINSVGTTVGVVEKLDVNSNGPRAVRWEATSSEAIELGILGINTTYGYSVSEGYDINDSGSIVGYAAKYDITGKYLGDRAVRWDASDTKAVELGILGTQVSGLTATMAFSVNNGGVVVGWVSRYDDLGNYVGEVATFWGLDNVAVDLNTLIDPASGWTLIDGRDINDSGWIAGTGMYDPDGVGGQDAYERLWLMQVPAAVPEPGVGVAMAVGALGLMIGQGKRAV